MRPFGLRKMALRRAAAPFGQYWHHAPVVSKTNTFWLEETVKESVAYFLAVGSVVSFPQETAIADTTRRARIFFMERIQFKI
jgi:hypothetical protein